jgi:hypothetical protein
MDREVFPELTPREALSTYLADKGSGPANSASAKKVVKGDGHSAHRHIASTKHVASTRTDPAAASRAASKKTNRGLSS